MSNNDEKYTELFINLSLCHWLILVFSSRFYFRYIITIISTQSIITWSVFSKILPMDTHSSSMKKIKNVFYYFKVCYMLYLSFLCYMQYFVILVTPAMRLDCIMHTTVMFSNEYLYIFSPDLCAVSLVIYLTLTLKWLGHFLFQNVILFSNFVLHQCSIFLWKWFNTMNV